MRENRTPLTAAQKELAARYVPLAYKEAGRLYRDVPAVRRMGLEDARGVAMLGLCVGARGYDPALINPASGRPYSPSTYLTRAIRSRVLRAACGTHRRARSRGVYAAPAYLPPEAEALASAPARPEIYTAELAEGCALAEAAMLRALGPRRAARLRRVLTGRSTLASEAAKAGKTREWMRQQKVYELGLVRDELGVEG